MFKEREQHEKLYVMKHEYEKAQPELTKAQECIALQRTEINSLLKKLSKYHPREVKDYPKCLLKNGMPDPEFWSLTEAAQTDEDTIKKLREELDVAKTRERELEAEVKWLL